MKSVSKLNKLLPKRSLNVGGRLVDLSEPLIMGILNVTPDSFYDGGKYNTLEKATIRIEKMIEDGVSIIDIGGCSTRPGSEMINQEEEWSRICDIIKICSSKYHNLIISVDTFRSEIAKRSFEEGANIINDVSGGSYDDKMFQTISDIKVPYVLMHLRGKPNNMMSKTNYKNLLLNLIEYFDKKTTKLKSYGINDIIIDPGFGFAKDFDQNYDILNNLNLFNIFDLPILVGLSRKSFVKKKYGVENSLKGTLDLNKIAIENGANIIRVHDVLEHQNLIKNFTNNS
ncbi:MAG: dihydropteroate synthase [Cytophagia bacterium]|nr:dihydropteroate synthase [Cytophagia bacterium]